MKKIAYFSLFALFFTFLFKIYYSKIGAFGCFDDCFNFTAGYFLLQGKKLYSEIFFNHQPLMAVFSYIIQFLSHPETLYKFILYHRIFIFLFSSLMNLLLIFRFGWRGVLFAIFYEPTKYYLFGDRFLAEAMITYPLVYLAGLVFEKLKKKTLSSWDYLISSLFAWLIIFSREPFIPLALFLLIALFWEKKLSRDKYLAIAIFLGLSTLTLLSFSLSDYFFNVFEVNFKWVLPAQSGGFLKIFAYPFYILFNGVKNYFHLILIGLDLVFLASAGMLIFKKKAFKKVVLAFLILGLANIRFVPPGTIYYAAFHMVSWYGLFLILTFFFVLEVFTLKNRNLNFALISFLIFILGFIFLSPQAFFREKIDKDYEFTTNYANYYTSGTVIKLLADQRDTLFVDGLEELIYQQANLASSYKYSFYTSVMPRVSKYSTEREKMFETNPPTFYYGSCPDDSNPGRQLPKEVAGDYERLYFAGKPSCLFIKKTKIPEITKDQWEEIKKLEYYLPLERDIIGE